METLFIKEMIKSHRISLSNYQIFWHFSILLFLFVGPLFATWSLIEYYILNSYTGVRKPIEIIDGYLFLIPMLFFYFYQKRKLKLKEFKLKVSNQTFKDAFEKTALELNWNVEINKPTFFRAHRDWNWSDSWGELITIIKDGDRILINSICDPNAIFISVVSYGWNKRNVKTFIKNLETLQKQTDIEK